MNIGLVYNWPEGKNSELDLIGRICLVLDKQGHKGIIIDPFGKLLDLSGVYVTPVEFVDAIISAVSKEDRCPCPSALAG